MQKTITSIKKTGSTAVCVFLSLIFLGACAPELTFYVTRPAKLPVENVSNITIGSFKDGTGEAISLPGYGNRTQIAARSELKPTVDRFTANHKAAALIRSMIAAGLSSSGQYRLIDGDIIAPGSGGPLSDPTRTAVISADVRYYEFTDEDAEKTFHLLLAIKGGLSLKDQALLMAARQGIIMSAKRDRKGFEVNTPYIEKIAALEVSFDMTRQSNGEKIIETQRYRAYYTGKWGGNPDTSHLPDPLKNSIVLKYGKNDSLSRLVKQSSENLKLALLDPDEYLARGGKLQINRTVARNSLQIQADLARRVVDAYLRQISRYTEKAQLEIASGDAIAVNYLQGNAYELAINRLENLQRQEEDSYNLALAYESIAEYRQAARYYQEALSKNPGSELYKKALHRVQDYR